ncbi:MAG: hypothetical protein AB7H85_05245 [Dehalococcoidia bacterium]
MTFLSLGLTLTAGVGLCAVGLSLMLSRSSRGDLAHRYVRHYERFLTVSPTSARVSVAMSNVLVWVQGVAAVVVGLLFLTMCAAITLRLW